MSEIRNEMSRICPGDSKPVEGAGAARTEGPDAALRKQEVFQAKPTAEPKRPEQQPTLAAMTAASSKDAWERPGTFHVERDSQGGTTKIERWLSLREGKRPASEESVQGAIRQREELGARQDSGHIIGYSLGGPPAETHGRNLAEGNQVGMNRRINNSYMGGIEQQVRAELLAGAAIYAEANVRRDPKGQAVRIDTRYSVRAPDGTKQPREIAETSIRLDKDVKQTAATVIKAESDDIRADFNRATRKGTKGPAQ